MVDLRTIFGQARTNIRPADAAPEPVAMTREQERERIEQDAATLPTEGPVAQIVGAIDDLLWALQQVDGTTPAAWSDVRLDPARDDPDAALEYLACDPVGYALRVSLYRLGQHAFRLTGSIETMRAIHHKAVALGEDPENVPYRRDVLDRAWNGIGDERGSWIA